MFATRTRRILAASALLTAAAGGLMAHAPTAEAKPTPAPSLPPIGVFLFCDDGSPTSEPFSNNYAATTDAKGHFSIASGHVGWPDAYGDIIPARNFIPRQFTGESFTVFAPDPAQINPYVVTDQGALPNAKIDSGKIPKGATKVTCGFVSPGDFLGPNFYQGQTSETDVSGTVIGYTVPAT